MAATKNLAVFDFDRTIVDDDSDDSIIRRLRETRTPPAWDSTTDWTPYMGNVFEHAFTSGMSQADILMSIASMRAMPGAEGLLRTLRDNGWDILILTDANSVFVQHWLESHGLVDCVTSVITNRAFWQSGRLFIEPCMHQTCCPRCPSNLCKSMALTEWCSNRSYDVIVYTGDGRNDYCPATYVPANGTVFPRRGFPLEELIKRTFQTPSPQMKAKVVPWDDHYTITQQLFPKQC